MTGLGDVSFLGKVRIFSANEQHGNYILTFFVGGSIPTGVYENGSAAAVVTPYLAGGKGWGKFDVESTFGAGMSRHRSQYHRPCNGMERHRSIPCGALFLA